MSGYGGKGGGGKGGGGGAEPHAVARKKHTGKPVEYNEVSTTEQAVEEYTFSWRGGMGDTYTSRCAQTVTEALERMHA